MTIDRITLHDLADIGTRIRIEPGFNVNNDTLNQVRSLTPEDMAPFVADLDAWLLDDVEGLNALRDHHGVTPPSVGQRIADSPRGRSYTIPVFFNWLRTNQRGPFVTTTTEETTVTLPTSPRNAFPLAADAHTAYDRWRRDQDPRLPNEMALYHLDSFVRDRIPRGGITTADFWSEALVGWEHDSFVSQDDHYMTNYAQGFWRDVRDLGYGTPTWTTTGVAPVTHATIEQFLSDYATRRALTVEQMEPWRATFVRYVNTVGQGAAHMDEGWLTSKIDEPRAIHSSLDRLIRQPQEMPSTLPAFARWLMAAGQTAPDPEAAAVPSGDSTALPINSEHPDWGAFWERARTAAGPGYITYWETLADRMGYVRPVQNERIWVDLVYRVEVEAPVGTSVHNAALIAQPLLHQQIRSGQDLNRQTQSISQRRPMR